ncbi:fasciclin-like arabinogalactan protein 14 [Musa acuminata AAA Group]|uniref:fasciclin-like arabinogalactan protein 14 n=1 Tax=Musa acuminata AAA Group TaxID=214697 RepID=UPI0031DF4427
MAFGAHASVLLLLLLLFVSSASSALDIVEILQPYPEYSTFTKYLTQTKVADEINRRKTITVLVVNDSAIAPLSSLSGDALKNAISVHVILDYYDPYTLDNLPNKTALLTTLFQASGHATDRLGFLNYTELPGEQMVFGSAAPGAPLNSELNKVVAVHPYDISVLGISAAIVPSGSGSVATTSPTRKLAPAQAPTIAPRKKTGPSAPAGAPKSSPTVAAPVEGPAGSATTPTGAPKSSPTVAAPIEGPTGSAASPVDGKNADADTTSSHAKSTEAPSGSDKPSSATRTIVDAVMGLVMGVYVLGAL